MAKEAIFTMKLEPELRAAFVAEAAAIDLGAVMDCRQPFAKLLNRGRERLERTVHVGEQRVAAAVGRHFERI